MLRLIKEADLSPERAAKFLGVSGMTLRRWQDMPGSRKAPKIYANACLAALHQLIAEGYLPQDSPIAHEMMQEGGGAASKSVEQTLGLPKDFLEKASGNSDVLARGLSKIGAKVSHQEAVDHQEKKIFSFSKWGASWKRLIEGMTTVIKSPELTLMDKLVAYGALFYLISPFDLIPDAIPGIGYLDDFAILSLALMYYERRYRHLFKKDNKGS